MKHFVMCLPLWAGLLASGLYAAPPAGGKEPASRPAAGVQAQVPANPALAELQRRIEEQARLLGAARVEDRQAAQQAIVRLHQEYLDAALAAGEAADDKTRQALERTLGQMERRLAADAAIAAGPRGRQMQLLLLLRKQEPQWVEKVASGDEAATAEVLMAIGKLKDPNHPAQALAAWCLEDPRPGVVRLALETIGKVPFDSEVIVRSLADLVARTPADLWDQNRPWHATPHWEAVKALARIGKPQAAPALLATYCRVKGHDSRAALAEALLAVGEIRLLPTMVEMIESRAATTNAAGAGKKLECTDGDIALRLVVCLTGQKPEDYGIGSIQMGVRQVVGFEKDEQRQEAILKFQAWWEKNKSKAPYKDLQPLELPSLTETPKAP